jgi:hypothetical protein
MTTVSSLGYYPSHQLPLFGVTWPVSSSTRSISPCRECGLRIGVVGEGAGPHYQSLRCLHGHFQCWLPRPRETN